MTRPRRRRPARQALYRISQFVDEVEVEVDGDRYMFSGPAAHTKDGRPWYATAMYLDWIDDGRRMRLRFDLDRSSVPNGTYRDRG